MVIAGNNHDVEKVFRPVLLMSRLLGLSPLTHSSTRTGQRHLLLRWPVLFSLLMFTGIILLVTLSFIGILINPSAQFETFKDGISTLYLPIIYTTSGLTFVFVVNFIRKLPNLFIYWEMIATRLQSYYCFKFPRGSSIEIVSSYSDYLSKGRLVVVAVVCWMCLAIFECTLETYFKWSTFGDGHWTIDTSFDVIIPILGSKNIVGHLLYLFHHFSSLIRTYGDLLVIVVTIPIQSHLEMINYHLRLAAATNKQCNVEWKQIRHHHLQVCDLIDKLNHELCPILFLSVTVNLFLLTRRVYIGFE